jgi:mono/diheme cytochrome c family protein
MNSSILKLSMLSLTIGTIVIFSCSLKQDSSSAANGNELYMQHCATCHGTDLRGGMSKSLLDGVWQFGDGRGYVTRNIRDGIPNLGMPSFEKTLTGDEINSIVDYLYEAEAAAGAKKPELT